MDRSYKENEEFAERRGRRVQRLEKAIRDNQLPMPMGDEDDQYYDDEIHLESPVTGSNQNN